MADDFLKWSEEVRDVGCSPHNILPSANQLMGESHIGSVGISFSIDTLTYATLFQISFSNCMLRI